MIGPDAARLKQIGEKVAEVIRADPTTIDAHADWGDRAPAVRIEVDQDKARIIGLSSAQVARSIGGAVSGATIGTYRERDKLIEVVLRAPDAERLSLGSIGNLQIQTSLGKSVPLSQIATIREVMEEPIIWRRSRELALTVRADLIEGVQAPDIAMAIDPRLAAIRDSLPPGYRVEAGGPFEDNSSAGLDRCRTAGHAGDCGRPPDDPVAALFAHFHGPGDRAAGHHRCCGGIAGIGGVPSVLSRCSGPWPWAA